MPCTSMHMLTRDNYCIIDRQLSAIEDSLMVKPTQAHRCYDGVCGCMCMCVIVYKTHHQLSLSDQTPSLETPMCLFMSVSVRVYTRQTELIQAQPRWPFFEGFSGTFTCCFSSCLSLSLTHTALLLKCETACGQLCSSSMVPSNSNF